MPPKLQLAYLPAPAKPLGLANPGRLFCRPRWRGLENPGTCEDCAEQTASKQPANSQRTAANLEGGPFKKTDPGLSGLLDFCTPPCAFFLYRARVCASLGIHLADEFAPVLRFSLDSQKGATPNQRSREAPAKRAQRLVSNPNPIPRELNKISYLTEKKGPFWQKKGPFWQKKGPSVL